MKCYNCPNELIGNNKTEEHIINDFLGGQLSSLDLICRSCNTMFGSSIDAELYSQLGFASELLVTNRDREKEDNGIFVESQSGRKIKVGKGLKPKPKLYLNIPGKNETIEITAKNETDQQKLLKKHAHNLKAKYGVCEHEEFLEYTPQEKFHFKNKLSKETGFIGFGGTEYFRAIGKIILNFYFYKRGRVTNPQKLIDFVNGRLIKNDFLFVYHPSHYKVHDLSENEFSHLLYLKGEKEIKAIYCYLEIFNFQKFICIIDDNFEGEGFEDKYCYDCYANKKLDKNIDIKLQRHHLEVMQQITEEQKKRGQVEAAFNEFEKRIERLQDL